MDYSKEGRTFYPTQIESPHINLPAGVFTPNFTKRGISFTQTEFFDLPDKFYGDICAKADFILGSYKELGKLSVLLQGVRGTGKSLLAKLISNRCGYPVLNINRILDMGEIEQLSYYLSNCNQPIMVLMEEFDKMVFNEHAQNMYLTILDGTVEQTALFLLTSNEHIGEYFYNRPGRVRYIFEYTYLNSEEVLDILSENLSKEYDIDEISSYLSVYQLNYDGLHKFIQDINRGVPVEFLTEVLNIRSQDGYFIVTATNKKNNLTFKTPIRFNPMKLDYYTLYMQDENKENGFYAEWDTEEDEVIRSGSSMIVENDEFIIRIERDLSKEVKKKNFLKKKTQSMYPECCNLTVSISDCNVG